jgi:hypothetical protein
MEGARDAHVEAGVSWPSKRVAVQVPRAVREWIAVSIGI